MGYFKGTLAFLLLRIYIVYCVGSECRRLMDLPNQEDGVFSQYSEDGVLISLLDVLGMNYGAPGSTNSKYYVEFGVENGIQCNTRILRERLGFNGLSMDGGNNNPGINLHEEFVTESNILNLLEKYEVPYDFDILSIDIDMFDLWILAKILRDGTYRPRVIVVETNPTLCVNNYIQDYRKANALPLVVVHPDLTNQTMWDGTRYSGANPKAFQVTAARFGYDMVHCERCGVNCFLVRRDALPKDCNNLFRDYIPMVPYPCFSTLTPGGGSMIGHPLDPNERPAILLGQDLLDAMTRPRGDGEDLFVGTRHVDTSIMGFACGQGTAASPRGWTGDWCFKIYPLASPLAKGQATGFDNFNAAYMSFYKGEYEAALTGFSELLEGADVQVKAFGPCVSSHGSEIGCVARAKCSFNAAVSALNMASKASGSEREEESQRHLALASKYMELSISFDQSDDHVRGMQQMISFLSTDPREVSAKLDELVSIEMSISGMAEDGGDLVTNLSVSSKNDIDATAGEMCERYSISRDRCMDINTALGRELRKRVFPFAFVPFDFTKSGVWGGSRSIPKCLLNFSVVKLLAAL